MSVRERILTIRLMEKLNANPIHAEVFGLDILDGRAKAARQTASNPAGNKS